MRPLFLFLTFCLPLAAQDIVHGDRPVAHQLLQTQKAVVVASEQAADDSWMQVYVFHPAAEDRARLIVAGLRCGALAVLPAGSRLELTEAARNGGAVKCRLLERGRGSCEAVMGGNEERPTAADYPFALPERCPAEGERLKLLPGDIICIDTADVRAAVPGFHLDL